MFLSVICCSHNLFSSKTDVYWPPQRVVTRANVLLEVLLSAPAGAAAAAAATATAGNR